jgi:DNA-binding MarR family transcriptional regulator
MSESMAVMKEGGSALPCFSTTVRRADRLLNRIYDDALRPSGLATTQYALLAILANANGALPHGQLASRQEMAGTTLSRTLKPLLRDGLVEIVPGADRRTRLVTITPRGEEALAQARPLWRAVQERVITDVGEPGAVRLLEDLASLIAQLRDEPGKELGNAR